MYAVEVHIYVHVARQVRRLLFLFCFIFLCSILCDCSMCLCINACAYHLIDYVSIGLCYFVLFKGSMVVAYVDSQCQPHPTLRHTKCELLLGSGASSKRCSVCETHRKVLNVLVNRHEKATPNSRAAHDSRANYRYLNTPEKVQRLQEMRTVKNRTQTQLDRIKVQLQKVVEEEGVEVTEELHSDLKQIVSSHDSQVTATTQPDSFQKIFWEQQQKALSSSKKGMRWHPLMIKWCLYLKHLSSKAYETLRESGCVVLPSQRTLRDYTHHLKSTSGFSDEVDVQITSAAKIDKAKEYEKCIALVMDEMYVKEDLVYNKNSGELVGFANLGDTNNHLLQFQRSLEEGEEVSQQPLARTMFVIMVRGLFIRLNFPYAQFPFTTNTSGDMLYDLVWEAVYRLERLSLKVMAITADGASTNRLFFRLHSSSSAREEVTYRVWNPYSREGRYVYFFSDAPHLIKTVRNAWVNSKRPLWVCLVTAFRCNRIPSLVLSPIYLYDVHVYVAP